MRIAFSMFVRHQGYRQYDVQMQTKCTVYRENSTGAL